MDEREIVLNRAKNAVLSRDFALGARLYKSLLVDDPKNLELLDALGQLYIKSGDDEKALPFYETIIKLSQSNVDAYNNMGGIYRRLKRYDESIDVLNKALKCDSKLTEVKYNLGFTYKLMGKDNEACDCFEYVVSENPNDVLAYNHLGSIYAIKKDYQKSISIYKRGLQVDPNHPILQYNLGRSYVAINSDSDAFKAFEAALRAKPSWKDAVKEYSALLNKYARTRESCEVIQNAINLYPNDSYLYYLLGKTYLIQTDYANAIKALEKAISLDKSSPKYYECLIRAYERSGKYRKGLETAAQGNELFPNDVKILREKVFLLFSAKKYVTGASILKKLSELTKRDPYVKDLMGQYYICYDNKKNVALCFERIRKINPSYQDYLYNAAYRYIQVEKFEDAVKCLKVFSAAQQKNPLPFVLLARIEEAKNNYKNAIDMLKKALAINPSINLAREGIERLNKKLEELNKAVVSENESASVTEVPEIPEEKIDEVVEQEDIAENIEESPVEEEFNLDDFTDTILENDEKIDPFAIDEDESLDEFMDEDLFREDEFEDSNEELKDSDESDKDDIEFVPEADVFGDEASDELEDEGEIEDLFKSGEGFYSDENTAEEAFDAEENPESEITNEEEVEISETEDIEESVSDEENDITIEIPDSIIEFESEEILDEDDLFENEEDTDSPKYVTQKIVTPDTSKMESLLEQAEKQANKALSSAEKAWQAAQNAADAAQSASLAEGYINQLAEETAQKAAEKASFDIEQRIQDAISTLQSKIDDVTLDNPSEKIEDESSSFEEVYNLLKDDERAEKYASEIELFKKLYSMGDYLSDDKKEEFFQSETRLQLEYLINNLSGKPGLFAICETLRESGVIKDEYVKTTPESQSLTGKELVCKVFEYIFDLSDSLEDKNLSEGIKKYINKFLNELN